MEMARERGRNLENMERYITRNGVMFMAHPCNMTRVYGYNRMVYN